MNVRRLLLITFFLGSFLAMDACAPRDPFSDFYKTFPEKRQTLEFLARNSKPIRPQPGWEQIYKEVRDCAAELGMLDEHPEYRRIRWYWAEEVWWLNKVLYRGIGCYGVYLKPRTIVFSKWAYERPGGIEQTVRHELLHHVISEPGHPQPVFRICAP